MTRGDTRKTAVRQIMERDGLKFRDAARLYDAGKDARALGEQVDGLLLDHRTMNIARALMRAVTTVSDELLRRDLAGRSVQDRLVTEVAHEVRTAFGSPATLAVLARGADRTVDEALEEWVLTTQSGNIRLAERRVWLNWYRAERTYIIPRGVDNAPRVLAFDRVHGVTGDTNTERAQLNGEQDTLTRVYTADGIVTVRRTPSEAEDAWLSRLEHAWDSTINAHGDEAAIPFPGLTDIDAVIDHPDLVPEPREVADDLVVITSGKGGSGKVPAATVEAMAVAAIRAAGRSHTDPAVLRFFTSHLSDTVRKHLEEEGFIPVLPQPDTKVIPDHIKAKMGRLDLKISKDDA